ncbi:glycoside hydrolase family 108 protein [Leptotrichia sp. OH3620_COT-345]|uniref:glycoside hydrolase family 108 protein n=1 Tax=Leptotrichia sp. OH3620_COT-345 TaxID=2491048 RepID=UPI001F487731|nr:N-acetylmuramidase [Leptotrichia sp. OH3620_COT-345]
MQERFDRIFKYLQLVEGGYFNHKNDKGGATKYGIIEVEARKYGYKGHMRDMPLSIAEYIYRKKYFLGNRLNEIVDDKVSLSVCDWIVNSGTWGAKKAQQALNIINGSNLAVDGKIGNNTLLALNNVNPQKFLEVYHDLQRKFYRSIVASRPTQQVFLKGWLNRVDRKEKFIKNNF